jgi:hypothetical protein
MAHKLQLQRIFCRHGSKTTIWSERINKERLTMLGKPSENNQPTAQETFGEFQDGIL